MSVGVILTRAQPIHLGHVDVIKQALDENDEVLVVGSANKSGTKRNPFPIEFRIRMLDKLLISEQIPLNRVKYLELKDWSMENAYEYVNEWGRFFYYNVVNKIGCKTFTFYYNDDISRVENWFEPDVLERVTIKNGVREHDISSTKVREAVLVNDIDYLQYAIGDLSQVKFMKNWIENCNKEDFIMQ